MEYIAIAIIVFIIWTVYLDKTKGQEWRDYQNDPFKEREERIQKFLDSLKIVEETPTNIPEYPILPSRTIVDFHIFMENKRGYMLSSQWDSKRKSTLKRDNYTCQLCDITGVPLDVHHKSYKNIPNEVLEDLVAICRHCHTEIHNKYGYPTTYQEYMNFYGYIN